jgi:hypothetical protein
VHVISRVLSHYLSLNQAAVAAEDVQAELHSTIASMRT